jgi:hypothetical protein
MFAKGLGEWEQKAERDFRLLGIQQEKQERRIGQEEDWTAVKLIVSSGPTGSLREISH